MNKKKWIIGIVVFVIVVTILEWKTKHDFQKDISNINKIIVTETTDTVKIKASKDNKIHITYFEGFSYKYNIFELNDVLKIEGNYKFPISLDLQNPTLLIEIPKNYGKNLEINTEKTCSIDNTIEFDDININSENE